MTSPASSMNFYGVNQGFYEIEMGFYDIEVRVYELGGRVYEMAPSEGRMLLLRHCPPTTDAEPVRGSLLRDLDQTLVTRIWHLLTKTRHASLRAEI